MADEKKITKMARPGVAEQEARQKKDKKKLGPIGGLGNLGKAQKKKEKEPEVMMLKMVEEGPANKHKSMKFQKMKKTTNSDGNIEFVELKAKGGRMGYKGGKSVKKKGGAAIRGRSKILR